VRRQAADWVLSPRQSDLSRLYDPLSKWTKLVLVERHNTPNTWMITGPVKTMEVFAPGGGVILDRNGEQISSGNISNIRRGASLVDGTIRETMTVSFVEDLDPIGKRIVLPTPSQALTTSVTNFPDAYDLRTGTVEDLILGYIRSHAGDLAQASRRVARLRVPVSLGRGGTTQVSGRLDHLGVLLTSLAEAGNLRIQVVHTEDVSGSWRDLVITQVTDLSDDIRFGTAQSTAAGIIDEYEYEIGAPTTTRAIVAGGGELAARDFLQLIDATAETDWKVVAETLIDQRHVDPASANKLAELTRAGEEAIEEGAGAVKVAFQPVLGPDLEYRRDVRIGDIVGYDLPGLEPAEDKIREATTTVTVEEGQPIEQVSVIVGTPDAALTAEQKKSIRALRAINVIQRSL